MNKYSLAFIAASSFLSSAASATMIDDFTAGTLHLEANPTTPFVTDSFSTPLVFGGERTVDLTATSGTTSADVFSYASQGFFSISNNTSSASISTLSWNSGSGIDLFEMTNNAFSLEFFGTDTGAVDFSLSVTDTTSASDSVSFSLSGASSDIEEIMFTSFSGIDFENITSISLELQGAIGSDFAINSLTTGIATGTAVVPVPPALLLFTSGLAFLSFSRRNK